MTDSAKPERRTRTTRLSQVRAGRPAVRTPVPAPALTLALTLALLLATLFLGLSPVAEAAATAAPAASSGAGPAVAAAAPTAPATPVFPGRPTGYVYDGAGILRSEDKDSLEKLLSAVDKATTAQFALATVADAGPLTVKDYAVRLFERWGIGQRGKDNGLLIVVAMAEREVQVEVGYGLEPYITDGLVGAVLDRALIPAFKSEKYEKGLSLAFRVFSSVTGAAYRVELPADLSLSKAQVDYYTGLTAQPPAASPIGGTTDRSSGGSAAGPAEDKYGSVIGEMQSAWQWLAGGGLRTVLIVLGALLLLSFLGVLPWRFWLFLLEILRPAGGGGRGGFGGGRGRGGFGGFGGGRSGGGGAGRRW